MPLLQGASVSATHCQQQLLATPQGSDDGARHEQAYSPYTGFWHWHTPPAHCIVSSRSPQVRVAPHISPAPEEDCVQLTLGVCVTSP